MDLASSAGDHPNNLIIPLDSSHNNSPAPPNHSIANHGQLSSSHTGSHANSPDRKPKKSSLTCTTCRARKVRCNGARDICSNCERLGFPCSYDDADPGALSGALPRRRVRQACLSCHSRKARCSGHMPACERCRAQGIECVYRPSKRSRIAMRNDGRSPQSQDGDKDDGHLDSDPGLTDPASTATPSTYNHDIPCPDESFDALIGRTFEKFFYHVHHIPMYGFLHRASLMERYHSGKVDRALLLALVGITSYLTDMGPGMREYGEKCMNDSESLIFADYSRPSTIRVQALVLIIKHRILSKKFSSAFMLLGIASRFATALRLNHECPNLCFLAQESRRRLMWALYCVDSGISGGYRDFSLWNSDRIYVGLPCNERNFEFDLPQPTERLVHDPDNPHSQQVEDIGSLALHIRIQHIRRRIMEFTKRAVLGRNIKADELQAGIWGLHKDLDDFAAHLPTSFQFSESSLRLRAYSQRICVFIMIHVWWRQCHCDLYRLALTGLREALPRSILDTLDESFIDHCQRQCVEHALAMADIFALMQKLNAKPVTDLDLAICAYQCARMLTYAYHNHPHKFDLSPETVIGRANVCLQAIKECCVGTTAEGIKTDLERLITHGISTRTTPSSPDPSKNNRMAMDNGFSRHSMLKNITVPDDHEMSNASQFASHTTISLASAPLVAMTDSTFPPSLAADPWVPESQIPPDLAQPMSEIQVTEAGKMNQGVPEITPRPEFSTSEINNAYDGGLDGLGLDNGMDYSMAMEPNLWFPNTDWLTVEALNGGVGA
ncbi:Fc.00g047450.m01.CDS01 [Cosmosporella sp. VM-42]